MSERRNFEGQDKQEIKSMKEHVQCEGTHPHKVHHTIIQQSLRHGLAVVKGRPDLKCLCTHVGVQILNREVSNTLSRRET